MGGGWRAASEERNVWTKEKRVEGLKMGSWYCGIFLSLLFSFPFTEREKREVFSRVSGGE